MFGLIHNVLFSLIRRLGGEAKLTEVLHRAGLTPETRFRLDTMYADDEWRRLFDAVCEVLGVTPEQAEEAFAAEFLQCALERFPTWFRMAKNSREFLLRQPVIHNTFAASAPDEGFRKSVAEKFRIELKDDVLIVHYRSPNHHCGLYKALAKEIFRHYGDEATIQTVRCSKEGARECEMHIRWARLAGTSD
jgi:hypothetical protein